MADKNTLLVTEHINNIENPNKDIIQKLREIFLSSDQEIAEHIKWNSPSFFYTGKMKEFDPKEYKRDLAVINLHRDKILVVFPTGNKIDAQIGLKGKDYPDGRKIVEIESSEDLYKKEQLLIEGIKNWISQIEK
ncbi:DUF1801 domain-containing protein [Flavobacterium reichenbachii]|uniref:DUF1801 domain-containing protein n=1 Tax=Flavobacterium reichenbachii TaxID=362418 RepID=UPI000B5B71BB|nr:DUF1801 domain-containing protein [Flavobacterium reichenbachii]OXB15968.1 hypothetical protein B0A68_06765 [Flavobacterium reichenbachii]